ncbi:hypothetical protein GALMADRAFT_245205 [Galerina marginata CBS 339.88]|uniref:pyranose dehydrogenase (acceptor) n=1 Tax=Galerina marginata (strain CBS 339.88) TaxID=685588 RepID=A0A067T730_GALM3|nr:hypothetical protein GALMADRAFT_245205 [Galerina marginata CBS 339.88]
MPYIKVEEVAQKAFDYIVVGGGTAGLAAAARISEDPSVTVLVLEAGQGHFGDPKIDVPVQFAQQLGNPQYDWVFMTAAQKHVNDRQLLWSRGKGLGGTSAINFYAWIKPPASDIDAIEKLGNPGWNWADYEKYTKKSETFHPPQKEQTDLYPHTFDLGVRGTSGPIEITIPPHQHTVDKLFQATMVNAGLKAIKDGYGGNVNGTWIASANLDPKTWTRSYSATAYLLPNIDRPNLHVLTGALVSRIALGPATEGTDRTATGVEFIVGEKTHEVKVNKEVVLSAGAVKSPQILELSGIGQPEVLSKAGIKVEIDLPGVGENVQEHAFAVTIYELDSGTPHETLDLLANPEVAAEHTALYAAGQGMLRSGLTSIACFPLSATKSPAVPALINKLEAEVDAEKKSGKLTPSLEEQLRLQIAALRDDTVPDCELVAFPGLFSFTMKPEPGKSYVSPIVWLNHPASRGSIHVENKDATVYPKIDPHYFESSIDLENLVEQVKFVRSLKNVEPWKSGVVRELAPGPEVDTDEGIREFIKNNLSSSWHTVGSCSMLPRSKGGVVDPKLKVYGTTNLRVADISIVPLHIAAHTQTTAYVIGEKVADLIKADLKK